VLSDPIEVVPLEVIVEDDESIEKIHAAAAASPRDSVLSNRDSNVPSQIILEEPTLSEDKVKELP
jgi:hypothetical protein